MRTKLVINFENSADADYVLELIDNWIEDTSDDVLLSVYREDSEEEMK